MTTQRLWQRVRRIWIAAGLLATVIFIGWSLLAFRARPEARAALRSDSLASVRVLSQGWSFQPAGDSASYGANLLFLPGGLVDPVAYAPLAHRVAALGYRVVLLRLPWRGALGRGNNPFFLSEVMELMAEDPAPWVVAGHSLGGAIASRLARGESPRIAGLVLLGTTHPRDFSLSHLRYYVAKVYGTADGIAPPDKVRAAAGLLPPATHWVPLEGGNHSQFGAYGFQPGDNRATLSRDEQQRLIVAALGEALDSASATEGP